MTFADGVAQRRRLRLLKLIVEDGGSANDDALLTAMRLIGERVGMDRATLRRLLHDLAERDCVAIDMVRDVVMVARVTETGRMAVAGDVIVGGVDTPFAGL